MNSRINFWCGAYALHRMPFMKLEHFALQVPEPIPMADWYVKHLVCKIARAGGAPQHGRFLTVGSVLFEIYRNQAVSVADYGLVEIMHMHRALTYENLLSYRDRLVKAGACVAEDI